MPASTRTRLPVISSGRFSRSGRSRYPVVSATSDHECPEPTARTVAPSCSALRTISRTSSSVAGR